MRIYFDACCLNRPFDDQSQDRIRLESEAIKIALDLCTKGLHSWVSSEAVEQEISRNPNLEKREAVASMLLDAHERLVFDDQVLEAARRIQATGIRAMDALHVALAANAGCDIMLTVDDELIARAQTLATPLLIRVENPVRWIIEVLEK